MAKKHDRKQENDTAVPSFRADTKLGKAFLSILEQNSAPEEAPSDKEDDSLSAPIDLLPDVEEVSDISEPTDLPAETAEAAENAAETAAEATAKATAEATAEAEAKAAGRSEAALTLKDFIDGLNLDVVPAGSTDKKPVPETKTAPDRTAETEKRPEASVPEKSPASVPKVVPAETEIETPHQAPKASRAPESRKKRRRTLPSREQMPSEKPVPVEKTVPEAEYSAEKEPVFEPGPAPAPVIVFRNETEPGSETAAEPVTDFGSDLASEPDAAINAETVSGSEDGTEPEVGFHLDPDFASETANDAEMISGSDLILDPDALFAADPEPEPAPEAETLPETKPEPKTVPEPETLSGTDEAPESESFTETAETAGFSAPFLRNSEKISSLALDFFIAALPLLGARIWYYGWRTVTVLLTSLAVCLFSELVFALIARKDPPSALKDRNFAVTALTVTLISSPNLPLWSIAALSALAVILFRGILGLRTSTVRSHPLNPAMAAFSLLLLFWHGLDRFGATPGVRAPLLLASPDPAAYGIGNPILSSLRDGVLPAFSPVSFLFGNAAGLLPMLFVLFALVYLLVRKTVPWQIPAAMIFSGILFAALLPRTAIRTDMLLLQSVLFEICSGTFLLCALFCGADTATVPYTGTGKLIFGVLAGAFTVLLRHFTGIVNCAPIGVVAANALTPLINRFTVPRPFGGK